MKIINLKQGSEEWKEWRMGGIGASDLPVLTGSLPQEYNTRYKLWEIKCGHREENSINRHMYHGMQYEEAARQWVSKSLDMELIPLCIQDDEVDFFRASLDGYCELNNVVVEIKCPMSEKTLDDALNDGHVHSYWIDQILWQMGLVGTEEGYLALWDYRTKGCIVVTIHWDEKRYQQMREKGNEFWNYVKFGIAPPLQKRDIRKVHNTQLEHLLNEYAKEDKREKAAKTRKDLLKKQILEFTNGDSIECDGHKVLKRDGNVTIDTEALVKDGIDIEKYKKRSKAYYVIKIENNKIIDFEEMGEDMS